jgi:hypothetical protein
VTVPAAAPGFALPEFVLTGKTSGALESQVTEFVRSLTYGTVENVPIARKFPVPCKLPTAIVFGTIWSESKGSGAAVAATVTFAVADTTLPSAFVHRAVIALVPALTPVTSPLVDAVQGAGDPAVQMVAIDGMLELHAMEPLGELVTLVTFWLRPVLPEVPRATNWPV